MVLLLLCCCQETTGKQVCPQKTTNFQKGLEFLNVVFIVGTMFIQISVHNTAILATRGGHHVEKEDAQGDE
jgi:hypothetical protein